MLCSIFNFIIWCKGEPTKWPANNCLQIMVCSCAMSSNCVWLQITFCSCVKETILFSFLGSFLHENGRSLHFWRCSVKNEFSDWLLKQLLNSIITKYFNLSVSLMSKNPQPLPSADWSNGHRQIMIFFLNLLSWLLSCSSCLTELTQSTKVLLPLEANKICVSIAANICHQVKPEFPLSPMNDNYMYP